MTVLQAFLLGIVQGLTEFLPISSSGHLVLIPYLFNWQIPEEQVFVFDVLVQVGTLIAVIAYFWGDLWGIVKALFAAIRQPEARQKQEVRLAWYLVLATIPAVVLGLLFKDTVEAAFSSPRMTAAFLALTALLLLIAEWVGKRTKEMREIKWLDALWVGVAQALSLFPGVSRSGATITGGMIRDLKRPAAARFLFPYVGAGHAGGRGAGNFRFAGCTQPG